jgi:pimeloyl-ACP methyl ester carboxylesterase
LIRQGLLALALAGFLSGAAATGGVLRLPRISLPKPTPAKAAVEKPADKPETRFVQVHPARKEPEPFARSPGKRRAVVLIHGYWLHFNNNQVGRAILKDWQDKGSVLVTTLGKDSDVFAFAYGQTVPVEQVARLKALEDGVAALVRLGYTHIVLVGHSAGGLVAREFVEDQPRSGVTKVVQVCAPNGGTTYADARLVPKNQRRFVNSLSRAERKKCLVARAAKRIPGAVQFVCVVGIEDLVVPCRCQWTKDLQDQGIPAFRLVLGHRQAMRKRSAAQRLAEIVREPEPRWSADQVAEAARGILRAKKPRKAPQPSPRHP